MLSQEFIEISHTFICVESQALCQVLGKCWLVTKHKIVKLKLYCARGCAVECNLSMGFFYQTLVCFYYALIRDNAALRVCFHKKSL